MVHDKNQRNDQSFRQKEKKGNGRTYDAKKNTVFIKKKDYYSGLSIEKYNGVFPSVNDEYFIQLDMMTLMELCEWLMRESVVLLAVKDTSSVYRKRGCVR